MNVWGSFFFRKRERVLSACANRCVCGCVAFLVWMMMRMDLDEECLPS